MRLVLSASSVNCRCSSMLMLWGNFNDNDNLNDNDNPNVNDDDNDNLNDNLNENENENDNLNDNLNEGYKTKTKKGAATACRMPDNGDTGGRCAFWVFSTAGCYLRKRWGMNSWSPRRQVSHSWAVPSDLE